MRISSKTLALSTLLAAGLIACAIPGCKSAPEQAQQQPQSAAQQQDTTMPIDTTAHAERLAKAMEQRSQQTGSPANEIQWEAPAPQPAPKQQPKTEQPHQQAAAPNVTTNAPPAPPSTVQQTKATQKLTRKQLLDALVADIRTSDDPKLQRALDAALITLTRPGKQLDHEIIASLDSKQREQLARFQSMVELFRHQLTSGDGEVNRRDAEAAMLELFGSMPLEIRNAELCRKVEGYGVYEPFEGHTFLAGRDNKMIIYIELDNFASVERGSDEYEVRLSQEVALYTDWDGQKVWRNEAQEIVDRSRNRRRDFFVVQMITLPARLSVGKYVLKVDVTDKNGGSIDAVPIEINLVADPSLVKSDRDSDRIKLIKRLLDEEDETPLQQK